MEGRGARPGQPGKETRAINKIIGREGRDGDDVEGRLRASTELDVVQRRHDEWDIRRVRRGVRPVERHGGVRDEARACLEVLDERGRGVAPESFVLSRTPSSSCRSASFVWLFATSKSVVLPFQRSSSESDLIALQRKAVSTDAQSIAVHRKSLELSVLLVLFACTLRDDKDDANDLLYRDPASSIAGRTAPHGVFVSSVFAHVRRHCHLELVVVLVVCGDRVDLVARLLRADVDERDCLRELHV